MNKNEYIARIYRKLLQENLEEKANSLMNKLNYDKETDLYDTNEFDYVQEGKGMCESCGGEIREGECSECGYRSDSEIMELGGMEDGHPRFGNKNLEKMSRKEKDDLMSDRTFELSLDRRGNKFDDNDEEEFDYEMQEPCPHCNGTGYNEFDDVECEWCDGTGEYDEYGDLKISDDMPSYKTKYRYNDDEEITEKLHGKQHRLDKNKNGRLDREDFEMLRKQQDEEQLYEIEFEKEVEEGNEFSGELAKALKKGKKTFEVDGKTYPVKESYLTEKWKGDVEVKQTGEYSDMSIEEIDALIKKQKAKNDRTQESGKKVSHADKTKMSQLYFAKRAKKNWKGKAQVKESLLFTESDLIDLIEKLVLEEKNKFKTSEPKGYKEYEKAHKADKRENENYLKTVAKKMTDYLKGMSDEGSKYEMKETKKFPTENGGMKKGIRKKYTPSDAVDDYNDAFSYPGQTNLRFDEIKPNKKNIEKYLKGHRTTGNAQTDEDGEALGNVVPSEVGEKFFKNFEENLYGQEQADASYKRQSQPVDVAGDDTEEGSLKDKRPKGGKGSKGKSAQNILNKLEESIEPKKVEKLNEEYNRMQQLMDYNRKTQ